MRTGRSDMSFPVTYLTVLAVQIPLWLCGGLMWAGFMMVIAGSHPINALIGGLEWAFFMWLLCGNLFAAGLAWRRAAEFRVEDRAQFRAALRRACGGLRLKVLAETPDEVVLGPRWALIRFRHHEIRVLFGDGVAIVNGPALSFRSFRRGLTRALAESADAQPRG